MDIEHNADHFSDRADAYASHRPRYPAALVEELARRVDAHDPAHPAGRATTPAATLAAAWDAGCGSGQLSVPLAGTFRHVVATDAGEEQIAHATPHPRVEYRHAPAEASGLPTASVELAVAAQAAHWFDLEAYYAEVRRVVRPGGLLALVSYGVVVLDAPIGPVVRRFDSEVLTHHWPPERHHVVAGYRTLPFPFPEIETLDMEMRASWTLAELLGYIETWSAVRAETSSRLTRAGREEPVRSGPDP